MKKIIMMTVVVSLVLNAGFVIADTGDDEICGCEVSGQFGPYLPATGTIKVLAIFVKFKDDTFDNAATVGWPSSLNTLPSWAPDLLAPTTTSTYVPDGLSHYYDEMSLGDYQVIGTVHPTLYLTPENESYYYSSQGRSIGFLNKQILEDLDSLINYADYDNLDPQDIDSDGIIFEPDGEVDMIMMLYRWWDHNSMNRIYSGIAGLDNRPSFNEGPNFFPITLDDTIIDGTSLTGSGITQRAVFKLPVTIAIHEFGHYLFGGTHYAPISKFGVMDGFRGTGIMSPYERIKLGWITSTVINSNQLSVSVPDALTTGTVYKINIDSDDYFLIHNRQAVSYYETTSSIATPRKGIVITHITKINATRNSIDVESAEGRWNWKKTGNKYVWPFEIDSANPDTGEDEIDFIKRNYYKRNPVPSGCQLGCRRCLPFKL